MHLIKVDATDSTNSLARELFKENHDLKPTCIVANQQLKGRGQRGSNWDSKPGQNLTFSVVYTKPKVSLTHQFLLSAAVSSIVVDTLEKFNVPKLSVKWPNDILSANLKIGGILIENVITEGNLAATIIGVGLNVNQTEFNNLPSAGSLKLVTGNSFSIDEVLESLLATLEKRWDGISNQHAESILKTYKKKLFRLNRISTFQFPDLTYLTGAIVDVTLAGKLRVRTDETTIQEFDLKEIKLCY